MSVIEYERLNAQFSTFYLTRYNPRTGNIMQVGKPQPTIEAALAAAARIDNRNRHKSSHLTFVDIVKPNARNDKQRTGE
jgi:hypothetical protein